MMRKMQDIEKKKTFLDERTRVPVQNNGYTKINDNSEKEYFFVYQRIVNGNKSYT